MSTTPTIPTLALPVFLCVLALTGALPSANLTRVRRAAAITGRFVVGPNEVNTLWPKTGRSVVIPYSIAGGGFEEYEEALIRFAARYWSERTCIDWTEGLPVEHQVYITRGEGDKAHSTLGRRPDRFALEQEIHLGEDVHDEENDEWIQQPLTFQTVIHEMGHAMGLIHEHQRWDRDRWLTVTGTDHNYRLEPVDQTTTFGKPYDWGSVMHYPEESCQNVPNVAHCQNGGFPNPKNCQQCICPEGFAGTCNHLAAGDNGAPPDCSKAVFASDSWVTLFGNVEAPVEHGHHRGPPSCCYYHINVDGTTGGHAEVKLSTVTAPTCNENCMDGWVEFKTAGYEIGGPKACCQSDVQTLGTMVSLDTPFVIRACAHTDETRFVLQYRRVCQDVSKEPCPPFGSSQCRDEFNKKHCARSCGYCTDPPAQAGPACNKRRRRAVDLRSNCPAMLQKYGSCDGHPYAKIMKLVCRKTFSDDEKDQVVNCTDAGNKFCFRIKPSTWVSNDGVRNSGVLEGCANDDKYGILSGVALKCDADGGTWINLAKVYPDQGITGSGELHCCSDKDSCNSAGTVLFSLTFICAVMLTTMA